jgi:hypothetical protein
MNSTSPFLEIKKPGDETIRWATQMLEDASLQVIRTFDLKEARLSHPDCPCPHHGTEACNCQMSVLLIYQREHAPASLLVHSFQETTLLYLVDTPEQPITQKLASLIRRILVEPVPGPIEGGESSPYPQGKPYEIP